MPLLSVFSVLLSSLELPLLKTFVALNGLLSIDVPLRNYSVALSSLQY